MSSSITGLPSSLTGSGIDADADLLPVYDQSAGTTKKITVTEVSKALTFLPSGTGPTTRTVADTLNALVRSGDYASTTNFNTARNALTETIGVKALQVGSSAVGGGSNIVFPARTTGRGQQAIVVQDTTFNGDVDPNISIGYNIGANGAPATAGENGLHWAIEGYYNDASGAIKMEAYLHYAHSDGVTTSRPIFVQINRTTGKVSGLRLKSDIVTFIADDGTAGEGGATTYTFAKNVLTVAASDASIDTQLVLSSASGKNCFLSLGSGTTAGSFRAYPQSTSKSVLEVGARIIARLYSTPNGGAGEAFSVGVDDNGSVGTFDAVNAAANSVASLVARAKSSQTAKTFQVQDSGSAVMFSADRVGNVVSGGLAAIATNATDGFLYMPSCAGTPTGVPTAHTGKIAFVYDSTNNIIYLYNGAWKKTVALT